MTTGMTGGVSVVYSHWHHVNSSAYITGCGPRVGEKGVGLVQVPRPGVLQVCESHADTRATVANPTSKQLLLGQLRVRHRLCVTGTATSEWLYNNARARI